MKKSCYKCRALESNDSMFLTKYKCTIGYEMDIYNAIPLENCPKPLTIKNYLKEYKNK